MVQKGALPSFIVTFVLVAGPLLSLSLWVPAPVAGAPVSNPGSWADSFELPDEWAGISSSENATIEKGSVLPDWAIDLGTGADGDLQVNKLTFTDTVRTALAGNVQAETQDFLPVNNSYGFSAGDEVLIIQMAGSTAGTWEFARVSGTAVSRLTLSAPVHTSYLGTSSSRAQVLRVPNWRSVTVLSGGVLTCSPWDGATGGIVCFRASGEVGIGAGGAIDVSGKGYAGGGTAAGGAGGSGGAGGATGGQSTDGDAGGSSAGGGAGGTGGSGGGGRRGGTGGAGGGAGAAGISGGTGKPGQSSTGSGAGPGQGGTNKGTADILNLQMGSGGGGGQGGSGGAGAGGGGGGGGGRNPGTNGNAGNAGGTGGTGSTGGTGGGAIVIIASSIRVEGPVRANGTAGQSGLAGTAGSAGGAGGNGGPGGGFVPYYYEGGGGGGGKGASGGHGGNGGGGGGGGSIWLTAYDLVLGQNWVSALGGAGGNGGSGGVGGPAGAAGNRGGNSAQPGSPGATGPAGAVGNTGAAGSAGKIRLDSIFSTGAVTPAGYAVSLARCPLASVSSAIVAPTSLARWIAFSVEYSVEGRAGLTFQLLDGVNGSLLGEWQSSGEGQESFNLSELENTSVRMRAFLHTSEGDTPALDGWELLWAPNRAPAPPSGLTIDGYPAGSPGSQNITSAKPVFNWSFSDNDTGQAQGAFNVSVWSGPGGTGELLWTQQKDGADETATYGTGKWGAPLLAGSDYYVTVRTQDTPLAGPLWSPASEMKFHLNAPPAAPGPRSPANGSAAVRRPVELAWSASADTENGPLSYEWEVSSAADFGTLRASGTTDTTGASTDLSPNVLYYWRVRATDGVSPSGWSQVWDFTVSGNRPPSVSAPPRMNLFFRETRDLNLTTYGSDPEDGSNLTWEATLTGGPGYTNYPPPLQLEVAGRTLRLIAGTVEGMFNVTLKAKDSQNFSGTGTLFVTILYTPPNQPPRLSLNGSTIPGGKTLHIDLLKHVADEEPSTLRWEVLTNNSLVTPVIEGSTLVLKAGNPKQDASVLIRLRVYDRYNLSDEANVIFTVNAVKETGGEGFPWLLAIAVVLTVIIVMVLLILLLTRRPSPAARPEPPAPAPRPVAPPPAAAVPAPLYMAPQPVRAAEPLVPSAGVYDEEVIQMDEEPPASAPPAPAVYRPARAPPPERPPAAAWAPPRPGQSAGAPRPPPRQYPPPARAVRPPQRTAVPPTEPMTQPAARPPAPRPPKAGSDLEEIMALLNKQR